MKWFRHDSSANMDAKLQSILLDYGLEGYGLYWYCLELISSKISSTNITFQLEHDARIIARNTGSSAKKVEEMMNKFIELELFESTNGFVTCYRMAKRLEQSMTGNSNMRLIIKELKDNNNKVMTQSDKVMQEETRSEEIRLDKKKIKSKSSPIPYEKIVDLYHEILPQLSSITFLTDKRKTGIRRLYNYNDQHQSLEWWSDYFKLVSRSNFLMGRIDQSGDHANWRCNLDFLININKFVKIVEGEYK